MIYPGRNNGNRIMDFLCENITAINYNLSYFCKKIISILILVLARKYQSNFSVPVITYQPYDVWARNNYYLIAASSWWYDSSVSCLWYVFHISCLELSKKVRRRPGRLHCLVTVNQSNHKNPALLSVNAKLPSFLPNRRDVSRNVAGSLSEEIPREATELR